MLKTLKAFRTHIKDHHGFKCDVQGCGYVTVSSAMLQQHRAKHSSEQPLVCTVDGCDTRFKRSSALREHMKFIHSGFVEEVVCNWPGCDFKTIYPRTLKKHILRHSGMKSCASKPGKTGTRLEPIDRTSFQCEWPGCPFVTTDQGGLARHRQTHVEYKDRKYGCDWPECGKRFTSATNLRDHLRKHRNEKRYGCQWPGCTFRSVLSCNVTKHMKTHTRHLSEAEALVFKNIMDNNRAVKSKSNPIRTTAPEENHCKTSEVIATEVITENQEVSEEKSHNSMSETNGNETKEILTKAVIDVSDVLMAEQEVKHNAIDNDYVSNDIIGSDEFHNDCHEFDIDLSDIHIKKEIEDSSYEDVMNCFDGFNGLGNDSNESQREVEKTSNKKSYKKRKIRIKCEFCCNRYKDNTRLQIHMKTKHKDQCQKELFFKCKEKGCLFSTDVKKRLNQHLKMCHQPKKFECDFVGCGHRTMTAALLRRHKKIHSMPEKLIQCQYCDKTYRDRTGLQIHMKTIHMDQCPDLPLLQCKEDGCQFVTKSKARFNQHMNQIHLAKTFECEFDDCDYVVGSSYLLKRHLKSHSNVKSIKCNHCDKAFKTKKGLLLHIDRKHTELCSDLPDLTCEVEDCQFKTKRLDSLKHHLKYHKRKVYVCPFDGCGKQVTTRALLIRHRECHRDKSQEDDESGPFKCRWPGCDKTFPTRKQICGHMNAHDVVKSSQCEWPGCDRTYVNQYNMRLHMKTHNRPAFACSWPGCDKAFHSKTQLTYHMNGHSGAKPFKCVWPGCGQAFAYPMALKWHNDRHSGPTHKCPHCHKRYALQTTLCCHIRLVHKIYKTRPSR